MPKEKKNLFKDAVSGKTILQNEEEIKTFPDEQKLREFTTKPVLQEMLKGVLWAKTKAERVYY